MNTGEPFQKPGGGRGEPELRRQPGAGTPPTPWHPPRGRTRTLAHSLAALTQQCPRAEWKPPTLGPTSAPVQPLHGLAAAAPQPRFPPRLTRATLIAKPVGERHLFS